MVVSESCMMMMQVNMLMLVVMLPMIKAIPQCVYNPPSNNYVSKESGEVVCSCRNSQPSYTGNMNFVKQVLSRVVQTERNVDLVIKECEQLRLELNFNNIGPQPINLRIYDSKDVEISVVELALAVDRRQTMVVKNVTNLIMEGVVQCRMCEERQGLFSIQIEKVDTFLMSRLNSTVPLKLTGRHLQTVKISDSSFFFLPWPGIFFHNASKVELVRNMFREAMPRSISISLGDQINISHNLLDVSEVLKVEQYEHVVVKCNRPDDSIVLPATCAIPIIAYDTSQEEEKELFVADSGLATVKSESNDESSGENKDIVTENDESDDKNDILVTVLGTVDLYGLLWILLVMLSVLLFLLFWCCCGRGGRKEESEEGEEAFKTSSALRPDILVIPFLEDESDEYSESSRAHLAQGVDVTKDPLRRHPQYVRVQGVRSEPMEDGVVCGSLTLGPSFGSSRDSSDIRTVSSNILKQQTFSKV